MGNQSNTISKPNIKTNYIKFKKDQQCVSHLILPPLNTNNYQPSYIAYLISMENAIDELFIDYNKVTKSKLIDNLSNFKEGLDKLNTEGYFTNNHVSDKDFITVFKRILQALSWLFLTNFDIKILERVSDIYEFFIVLLASNMANLNTIKFLIDISFVSMIFKNMAFINNKEVEAMSADIWVSI